MDRRQFLGLASLAAASATVSGSSCTSLSARFNGPESLALPQEKLLLTNGSIIDVSSGRPMIERHLLIENGKIAGVFTDESVGEVTADRKVDLGGAFIIPGLINAHCHLSLPGAIGFGLGFLLAYERQVERNAEECIKHGVTTVRDMLAVSDYLATLQEKISRGEVVGPRIIRSCAIDIDDGYADNMVIFPDDRYWKVANNPAQGREAVKEAIDQGADFIKVFQQPKELVLPGEKLPVMDVETLRAIREQAESAGKIVALHHSEINGLRKGIEAGILSLEHMVSNTPLTDADIETLLASKATVIPTSTVAFLLAHESKGDENWGKEITKHIEQERKLVLPPMVREFSEPELVNSTLRYFEWLSRPDSYESWHLAPWPDAKFFTAAATTGSENLGKLYDAGVTFGCGNDGGIPLAFPGALAQEMVFLEDQGLEPWHILKSATIINAELLGLQDQIGSIATGKIADLAIFEKNPAETAHNLLHPQLVFQSGRLVYQAPEKV